MTVQIVSAFVRREHTQDSQIEFTKYRWKKPDGERLAWARSRQCSRLGASAHVWGQKLLTFQAIYQ